MITWCIAGMTAAVGGACAIGGTGAGGNPDADPVDPQSGCPYCGTLGAAAPGPGPIPAIPAAANAVLKSPNPSVKAFKMASSPPLRSSLMAFR